MGTFSKGRNSITYRNFKNFNRDRFRHNISSQNWDDLDNFHDPAKTIGGKIGS